MPSIADADHRGLATDRNLDKMPNTCHLGAQRCTWVTLTSLSALKEIPAAAKVFSKARSSTSIKDVGAGPADPITNFRTLFLFPLQQTMPALYPLHPRAVLSQKRKGCGAHQQMNQRLVRAALRFARVS